MHTSHTTAEKLAFEILWNRSYLVSKERKQTFVPESIEGNILHCWSNGKPCRINIHLLYTGILEKRWRLKESL